LLLINPAHVVEGIDGQAAASRAGPAQFPIPPLNLAYLAALTPADWTVRIIDENMAMDDGRDWGPDLVGITALTPSAPRAYALAATYRARATPVVLGGIHVSVLPSEAVEHADAIVVGQAESAWPRLLADFEVGQLRRRYDGELLPLDGLPIPRRDLFPHKYFVEMVITSKGCSNACDFCSVWRFCDRRYRVRPVEEVVDELETLPPRKFVFFADDNLTLNRQRVIQLCRRMVERGVRRRYAIQSTIGVGEDEELLRWLKRSGCCFIFVGIESLNESPLTAIAKPDLLRLGPAGCEACVARIHTHGMAVFGSFIMGLDGDTTPFHRILAFTRSAELDCTLVNLLNPLPGTPLWERLSEQGRLLYTDFPADYALYAQDNVCFRPLEMSAGELQERTRKLVASLTRLPVTWQRAAATWRHTGDPYTTLIALSWNWRTFRGLRAFPMRDVTRGSRTVSDSEPVPAYAGK